MNSKYKRSTYNIYFSLLLDKYFIQIHRSHPSALNASIIQFCAEV